MTEEFNNLFSPIKIGPMTVRNRIVSSAHHPLFVDLLTGLPQDRMKDYWVAKAKGGVGLIETYLTTTHANAVQDVFRRPGAVEVFKKASDAVHEQTGLPDSQFRRTGRRLRYACFMGAFTGTDSRRAGTS